MQGKNTIIRQKLKECRQGGFKRVFGKVAFIFVLTVKRVRIFKDHRTVSEGMITESNTLDPAVS